MILRYWDDATEPPGNVTLGFRAFFAILFSPAIALVALIVGAFWCLGWVVRRIPRIGTKVNY